MGVEACEVNTVAAAKVSLKHVSNVNNNVKSVAENAKLVSYNMATPREA